MSGAQWSAERCADRLDQFDWVPANEAAAHLRRLAALEAENTRLREALELVSIAKTFGEHDYQLMVAAMRDIARDALAAHRAGAGRGT